MCASADTLTIPYVGGASAFSVTATALRAVRWNPSQESICGWKIVIVVCPLITSRGQPHRSGP
jgi:hypothetical protein